MVAMPSAGLRLLVAGALALPLVGLGHSGAGAQEASPAPPAAASVGDPGAEARLLALLNQARAAAGLPGMTMDSALSARARAHALGMANAGKLFHQALSVLPQSCSGHRAENVGRAASPDVVHKLFMEEPGHRAEILGPFNKVGIGIAVVGDFVYVTQDFCIGGNAGPPARPPAPKPFTPPKAKRADPPAKPAPAQVVLRTASVQLKPAGMGSPCRFL